MSNSLKIENQLCFPLYVCSKEIVRKYKPFLDKLDLTYTQYITMMILWEEKNISVKDIGNRLYLDSGTLTPLLKKLENKGYVIRNRDNNDERNVIISITDKGLDLKKDALEVPINVSKCINLDEKDAKELYRILYKIIEGIDNNE
jgi:DNA-binding MarR family transcriptional regulator